MDRATRPAGTALRRTGVSADQLTGGGLVVAAAAAVAIGSGRLGLGLALVILSALPDLFDGPVAKASGTAGPRGAFFDSVADRVSDALVLGGVAWYLASDGGGHGALLPFAVMAVSGLVSYERAKAESLGYTARGGLMERAERLMALCVGLAFRPLLVPVLWAMLVLTTLTAVQRFMRVWAQAGKPPVPARERRAGWRDRSRRTRPRSTGRSRDWRARRTRAARRAGRKERPWRLRLSSRS